MPAANKKTGKRECFHSADAGGRIDHPTASFELQHSIHLGDIDPLTKLVAFPAFERLLTEHLMIEPTPEQVVCLSIGDVDDLKGYVEEANSSDPSYFGHLAGNRVMAQLGRLTRAIVSDRLSGARCWCTATFGGDEIIIFSAVSKEAFQQLITELRQRLAAEMPLTVSFAYGAYRHPGPLSAEEAHVRALNLLATIDRGLFSIKRTRAGRVDATKSALINLTN